MVGGGEESLSHSCGVLRVHEMMMVESLWWAKADPFANHWAAKPEDVSSVLTWRRHELERVAQRGHYRWCFLREVEENCRSLKKDEQVEVRQCRSMLAEGYQLVEDQLDDGSLVDQGFGLTAKAKGHREGCSVGRPNEESK